MSELKRVTINLKGPAIRELEALVAQDDLDQTDTINRAVRVLHLVQVEGAKIVLDGVEVRML